MSLDDQANLINNTLLQPQQAYQPLDESVKIHRQLDQTYTASFSVIPADTVQVTEFDTFTKLKALNPNKSPGPDGIPPWVYKEFAEMLAYPISLILNCSYKQEKLPSAWKKANISPVPKNTQVTDINKHLRPISLTPVVSKLSEEFIFERQLKSAVLKVIDSNQYGVVPKSSTTLALISMMHKWLLATDKPGNTIRTVLFDFRKAFDLLDHNRLITKLKSLDLPSSTINWIIDFLIDRKQRVKLTSNCYSEWGQVRSGVPQGTKLGPWLYILMLMM